MVKKVNKVQNNAQNNVQNQQVNNNDCQHVQLGGMAYYDAKQYFLFSPQESGVNKVPRFRSMGVAQQMPDGTFDFVVQHRLRTQSELETGARSCEQDQGRCCSAYLEGVLP